MSQKGLAPIVIILLIAAGVGGYLIYSGKINLPQKQTLETKTSEVNETTDWKTYSNSSLGFSFSYPKQLDYLYDQFGFNHPDNPEGNLLLQNYDGANSAQQDPANFQLVISAYKNVDKVALETFVKDPAKVWNINNTQTFTPFMLHNKPAYKGKSIQKNEKVPTVWVVNNGYILTIYLETPESRNAAWFDEILPTFKFQ